MLIVNITFEGNHIASGVGRFVRRDWIRANFWRDMEEPCRGLSNIAFEIFDRYGRLNRDLKTHSIRKGIGAWGSEFLSEQYITPGCFQSQSAEYLMTVGQYRHQKCPNDSSKH
jgi:hypothetical protein